MFIQQIYTGCLSQASYYIESEGEAAIIDPMREPGPYLRLAKSRNARIQYIFETHFHADFVSGHVDIGDMSGATIVFGPNAQPHYRAYVGKHHEIFTLGNCSIQLLHTPGHTIESSCFLLMNELGQDYAVFTGDTLFVGDVGRPDLMSGMLSKEELASQLYDSLTNVIMDLDDEVIVYPGHGAGSACGKNLGIEKHSTIGEQKKNNYALQPMSREQFIEIVAGSLATPPAYFFKDAGINKQGYRSFDELLLNNCKALSIDNFRQEQEQGAIIIDTRKAAEFAEGFIPGAINIGLQGEFAPWVGTLIDIDKPILLVTDLGTEAEAVTRLARIGYEQVKGYLNGGFNAWLKTGLPINTVENIDASDFFFYYENPEYTLIDVRRPAEIKQATINRVYTKPLGELQSILDEFTPDRNYLLFCKGGYRSMIAASILKANGINHIVNVDGGVEKIIKFSPELVLLNK
ncbi:MAG: MBL fold metallo-hydrolase [Bacteroidetes bacterium]|nr:MBL fold metallo-hydrolase [Bacteroidota bacterium]